MRDRQTGTVYRVPQVIRRREIPTRAFFSAPLDPFLNYEKRLMCLIAEHDPWDIQLLKLYAERLGFGITQSFETQSVVPLARQAHPDVMLLKADLPGTLGCQELLCQLRSDPATQQTAIDGLQACLERAGVWQKRASIDLEEECL
jgi:hypothetical protein